MPSGRPVSFWLRHEEIEEIDDAAEKAGLSRSEFVKAAIRLSLLSPRAASAPSSRRG
jgi:metal-responsive CopG/Arc/MetJ family transcriptional regulator